MQKWRGVQKVTTGMLKSFPKPSITIHQINDIEDAQNRSLSSSLPSASAGLRIMSSWLQEMDKLWWRGGSSASGPASVGEDLIAPLGWALSWMVVAAARAVHGRLGSRAMRGTSVIHTRACTATFQLTSRDMKLECVHVSGHLVLLNLSWWCGGK